MADEIHPESILPEEVVQVVRRIADDVREAIRAKATVSATGQVVRPQVAASSQSSASVTINLQGILSAEAFGSLGVRLFDPVESKKFWESNLGRLIAKTITDLIIQLIVVGSLAFYEDYRSDVRERQTKEFISSLVTKVEKQFEAFWLAHKESSQPQSTPKHEEGD
jgi:hypothetical protein